MYTDVIVTRHPATEAWIREEIRVAGRDPDQAVRIEQVSRDEGAADGLQRHLIDPRRSPGITHVWGTLPLDAIASAGCLPMVYHAVTVAVPRERRGEELSEEEFTRHLRHREWVWAPGEGRELEFGLFPREKAGA